MHPLAESIHKGSIGRTGIEDIVVTGSFASRKLSTEAMTKFLWLEVLKKT